MKLFDLFPVRQRRPFRVCAECRHAREGEVAGQWGTFLGCSNPRIVGQDPRSPITGRKLVTRCTTANPLGRCQHWEARWEGDTYVTPQGSRIETGSVPEKDRLRGAEEGS